MHVWDVINLNIHFHCFLEYRRISPHCLEVRHWHKQHHFINEVGVEVNPTLAHSFWEWTLHCLALNPSLVFQPSDIKHLTRCHGGPLKRYHWECTIWRILQIILTYAETACSSPPIEAVPPSCGQASGICFLSESLNPLMDARFPVRTIPVL